MTTIDSQCREVCVNRLFFGLKTGKVYRLSLARRLASYSVYLSELRLSDGQLLIVASHALDLETIKIYGLRWEINVVWLFKRPWF